MPPARRPCYRWLLAALFAAVPASARPPPAPVVALDSARSSAEFRVKVMWLVRVRGYFDAVRGAVDIDRFRNQAVVDAHIDAAGVRMNVRGYEDWVKSSEFFDVAAHPDIHFVSDAFPLQRLRSGGDLPGHLTVRGVSQPVGFALAAATCAQPGYDCAIVASGTINRSRFGMHSRLGTLGDKVDLRFRIFVAGSPALSP